MVTWAPQSGQQTRNHRSSGSRDSATPPLFSFASEICVTVDRDRAAPTCLLIGRAHENALLYSFETWRVGRVAANAGSCGDRRARRCPPCGAGPASSTSPCSSPGVNTDSVSAPKPIGRARTIKDFDRRKQWLSSAQSPRAPRKSWAPWRRLHGGAVALIGAVIVR